MIAALSQDVYFLDLIQSCHLERRKAGEIFHQTHYSTKKRPPDAPRHACSPERPRRPPAACRATPQAKRLWSLARELNQNIPVYQAAARQGLGARQVHEQRHVLLREPGELEQQLRLAAGALRPARPRAGACRARGACE